MKRHPSLLTLTHDHHHVLVWARRLRLAADSTERECFETASGFLEFFDAEMIRHFREEEELLFPLIAEQLGAVPDDVAQLLTQRVEIHAFVHRLGRTLEGDAVLPEDMRTLGRRLEAHVRLEEKQVFPEIEQAVPGPELAGLTFGKRTRLPAGEAGIGVPHEGPSGSPPMPS